MMFVYGATILDVLQSMVELGQYRAWLVAERVGDIIVGVEDFGYR